MIVRLILGIAAVMLAGASLAMSLAFVRGFGDDTLRYVFFAVAAASCAFKLAIPAYLHTTKTSWRATPALAITWAAAFAIDAAFTGGFLATSRDVQTRDLQAAYDARREIERKAAKATKDYEREANKERRPVGLVRVDLEAAKKAAGRCETPAAMELPRCSTVTVREREMADIENVEELRGKMEAARAALANTKEVVVYPEAARFGKLARTALPSVEDGHVAAVLWLLMLLLFEFGAVTAFRAAMSKLEAAPAPAPVVAPVIPRHDALFKALADGAAGVGKLANNRQADGRLRVAQKATSQACGMSPRAFGAALQDLAQAGRIDLVAGSRGTFVRVVS